MGAFSNKVEVRPVTKDPVRMVVSEGYRTMGGLLTALFPDYPKSWGIGDYDDGHAAVVLPDGRKITVELVITVSE